LYRRLPHGPNGLDREEVARHQRARIFGAMIESVARCGYQETTVADVIALAGVSRRAFYEQFANKEECFLATYDIVVARARKQVIDACGRERGWSNRLHASCKSLLHHIADEPNGPRLVLVDALGVGPRVRERMELAGLAFERLIAVIFQLAPDGVQAPPLAARAIVGGVRHVAFLRLLEGRERELAKLTDEVLDWIEAYRSPLAARLGASSLLSAPTPPPVPVAFRGASEDRARALGSLLQLTVDRGYAGLSDPQIARFAGISTEAFHRQFASKEACFLAVLDEFVTGASDAVEGGMKRGASWPEAVRHAIAAFIGYLLAHEALLRIAFVDVFEVGPAIVGRMTRAVDAVTELLAAEGPAPRRGATIAREAVTGASWAIVSSYVTSNRVSRLPGLVDHLTFVVLAPYVGPKAAIDAINAARLQAPAA
jgi:AcrR family transcriptional regulator